MNEWKKRPEKLSELLNWISGSVALITVILSLFALVKNLAYVVIVGILVLTICLSAAFYIIFSKVSTADRNGLLIPEGFSIGKVYRFSKSARRSAIVFTIFLFMSLFLLIAYQPARMFIDSSLVTLSTATTTTTATPTAQSITPTISSPNDITGLMMELTTIQNRLTSIEQQVSTLEQSAPGGSTSNVNNNVQNEINSINSRVQVIENAILDNPERSLALALLSKDLENTKKEIERLYDLLKWFIALMLPMSISLLGLAASNFVKKPEQGKKQNQKEGNE